MQYFDWNEDKNEQLKIERGVGFEDVVTAINESKVLAHYAHPNSKKYPGQKVYVVEIDKYAYMIPCIEDEQKIFFKTIFPSRKATKRYIIKNK